MSTDIHATPAVRRRGTGRFALHFLEMIVAMAIGMVALHPVWSFLLHVTGSSWLMSNAYTGGLIMATNMMIAMSAWMRFRSHGWRPIAEMGVAMYLPFLVLFVPLGLGLISLGAMYLWGHVGMLIAMALAMLARPGEYRHG
jgi:hypothetical protein